MKLSFTAALLSWICLANVGTATNDVEHNSLRAPTLEEKTERELGATLGEKKIVVRAFEDFGFNFPFSNDFGLEGISVLVRQAGRTVGEIGMTGKRGFFTIQEGTLDGEGVAMTLEKDVRVCVNLPSGEGSKYLDFERISGTPLDCSKDQGQPAAVEFACAVNPNHKNNPGYGTGIVVKSNNGKKIFPKGDPESTGTGSNYCYIVKSGDYVERNNGDFVASVEFGFVNEDRVLRVETDPANQLISATDESGATFSRETGGSGFVFVNGLNLFEDVKVCLGTECVVVEKDDDLWGPGQGGSTIGKSIARVKFD